MAITPEQKKKVIHKIADALFKVKTKFAVDGYGKKESKEKAPSKAVTNTRKP